MAWLGGGSMLQRFGLVHVQHSSSAWLCCMVSVHRLETIIKEGPGRQARGSAEQGSCSCRLVTLLSNSTPLRKCRLRYQAAAPAHA